MFASLLSFLFNVFLVVLVFLFILGFVIPVLLGSIEIFLGNRHRGGRKRKK